MRANSRILVYIDTKAATDAGIRFYLSKNGVILTPGNEAGFLEPKFFKKVQRVRRSTEMIAGENMQPIPGWEDHPVETQQRSSVRETPELEEKEKEKPRLYTPEELVML
jgi:2'-phosphotransferase